MSVEEISKKLKDYVAQFDSDFFLNELSWRLHTFNASSDFFKGLSSPLRHSYFLAALNITSDKSLVKFASFDTQQWVTIKELVYQVDRNYDELIDSFRDPNVSDIEWQRKRKIAGPSFIDYHHSGPLNYQEQVIERIVNYFEPFKDAILGKFGLSPNEFVDIAIAIDEFSAAKLQLNGMKFNGETWRGFMNGNDGRGLTENARHAEYQEFRRPFTEIGNIFQYQGRVFK